MGRQAFDAIDWVASLRRRGCSDAGEHSNLNTMMAGKAQPGSMQPFRCQASARSPLGSFRS